ncbi:MAG: hypothetical protein QXS81_05130 [Candidatus Micrarchaeaceae archaeon]
MTEDADDIFAEIGKKLDKEFAEENKKLPPIANISVIVPESSLYAAEEGISEGEVPETIKKEDENDGETYTLGDMRAWYKELRKYPYHKILTFGHGKARVWGEGWSGGEFVSNVKDAAEVKFIEKLGRPLYIKYMDMLMEPITETRPKISMTTKRAHISTPLIQKATPIAAQSSIPSEENKIRETEEEVKRILEENLKTRKKEERLKA